MAVPKLDPAPSWRACKRFVGTSRVRYDAPSRTHWKHVVPILRAARVKRMSKYDDVEFCHTHRTYYWHHPCDCNCCDPLADYHITTFQQKAAPLDEEDKSSIIFLVVGSIALFAASWTVLWALTTFFPPAQMLPGGGKMSGPVYAEWFYEAIFFTPQCIWFAWVWYKGVTSQA